jgi:predicted metal-binding membrane protein
LDRWIEAVARRERALTLAGLAGIVGLAWLYLFRLSQEMASMAAMAMAHVQAWTLADAALTAAMWTVMMAAMMLPGAAPMLLVFTTVNRKRRADHSVGAGTPLVSTGLFTLGYLLVWGGFSLTAATAQWGLQAAALLSDDALTVAPVVGAAVLIAAGIYQLTPLKYACLARCRTPLGFLLSEWRDGDLGALVMGLRHGLFCLGCCWVLMTLLFVGGVMNLAWVAAITVFVLLEKVLPAGRAISWVTGLGLILWGIASLRGSP